MEAQWPDCITETSCIVIFCSASQNIHAYVYMRALLNSCSFIDVFKGNLSTRGVLKKAGIKWFSKHKQFEEVYCDVPAGSSVISNVGSHVAGQAAQNRVPRLDRSERALAREGWAGKGSRSGRPDWAAGQPASWGPIYRHLSPHNVICKVFFSASNIKVIGRSGSTSSTNLCEDWLGYCNFG